MILYDFEQLLKTVIVNGHQIKLLPSNVLGVGGEATVVRSDKMAIKIFHKPSNERTEKLIDFLKIRSMPKTVCVPKILVTNVQKQVVGYAMQLLSPQYEVVQQLSSKKYRKRHPSITSATITDLFLNAHSTTSELHPLGITIGDYNDLNTLFWKSRMMFIDADSFQFGAYPCMVGTDNFLDPQLYNLNLATKPYFKPLNDWYSWFIMYIRSLLMVHPYGGVHKNYKTIPQRAEARITFLDSKVKYPKSGFHPDLLNNDLKDIFHRMFKKGERFIPPSEILKEYRDSLINCHSCSIMYPSQHACPQCAKVNVQQIQRRITISKKPGKQTIHCEQILATAGNFVWRHIANSIIRAITLEDQNFVFHCLEPNKLRQSITLPHIEGHPNFGFFDKYLVINNGLTNSLDIYEILEDKLSKIDRSFSVDCYNGERIFACDSNHLLRITKGYLFRTNFGPYGTIDKNINAIARNQTWITAYGSMAFGMQRFFNVLKFFTYRFDNLPQSELWYPPVETKLKDEESILDMSVKFAAPFILLLIKTEKKGKTFTHVFVLYKEQIKNYYRVDAISSDVYHNIHGKSFAVPKNTKGFILHPTDDGIVQEIMPDTGMSTFSLMSETEPFVSEGDTLNKYKNGILVTSDKTINFLTIT
ncbi:hypothetical protein LCGC14_0629720 [marine sediment metagenome]|uniref:Protein kinase domain-containing protein n=1 Tax=marine sediment metagenome TaxID=412755 RepID=A0A0F9TNN2_9ZZZZ